MPSRGYTHITLPSRMVKALADMGIHMPARVDITLMADKDGHPYMILDGWMDSGIQPPTPTKRGRQRIVVPDGYIVCDSGRRPSPISNAPEVKRYGNRLLTEEEAREGGYI